MYHKQHQYVNIKQEQLGQYRPLPRQILWKMS